MKRAYFDNTDERQWMFEDTDTEGCTPLPFTSAASAADVAEWITVHVDIISDQRTGVVIER